jgi:L-lactate permease
MDTDRRPPSVREQLSAALAAIPLVEKLCYVTLSTSAAFLAPWLPEIATGLFALILCVFALRVAWGLSRK